MDMWLFSDESIRKREAVGRVAVYAIEIREIDEEYFVMLVPGPQERNGYGQARALAEEIIRSLT